MLSHHHRVRTRQRGERGASLVEYALLVALIAVVAIVSVTFMGSAASDKFTDAKDGIDGTTTTTAPTSWPPSTYGECESAGWQWFRGTCYPPEP